MNKDSTQNRYSRYVAGGETEVNSFALEWWEKAQFQLDPTDIEYVVPSVQEGRLDLIAALIYGEPRWWWLIAQYNNILDPYNEVKEGVRLLIPSKDRASSIFSSSSFGGVPSKREVRTTVFPIV